MRSIISFVAMVVTLLVFASPALAEGEAAVAAASLLPADGLAALGISIAAIGGALAQAKVISSALDSIARNPGAAGQMFLPWILGISFVESLVIFVLVICLKVSNFI